MSLDGGEQAGPFLLVELDGEPRFALATSRRLVFGPVEHGAEGTPPLELMLAGVSRVELSRRRLELHGAGLRHVIGGLSHDELGQLAEFVASHRPAA